MANRQSPITYGPNKGSTVYGLSGGHNSCQAKDASMTSSASVGWCSDLRTVLSWPIICLGVLLISLVVLAGFDLGEKIKTHLGLIRRGRW